MDTQPNGDANAAPVPEKKKTLFDIVLTSTPVILTVVATFMVGRSTAEMTQAQYHRSLAGQNQSKAGDQWGFFQAKRIRGTIYETNADMLIAREEPVLLSRESLIASVKELAAKVGDGTEGKKVTDAIGSLTSCLDQGFKAGKHTYKAEQISKAFETMNNFTAPKRPTPLNEAAKEPKEKKEESSVTDKDGEQQQILQTVLKLIDEKKSYPEITREAIKLSDQTLHDAIDKAEGDGKASAKPLKDAEYVLEQIDQEMYNLALSVYGYLKTIAKDRAAELRTHIHELLTNYYTARHIYTQRRYERDVRSNQRSADLYEVRVYLSGAKSDRSLDRSRNFMYAMLVAQVGVIIASAALAVKYKSVVWMLAAFAGLAAVGFGGYTLLGTYY